MRGCVATVAVWLWAGQAGAGWLAMDGPEIEAALAGARLDYGGAWQTFGADGTTTYNAGRGDSQGRWRVEGGRYCSQWPPADGWACYAMEREDATGALRFIGESGDVTEGVVAE